MTAHARLIKPEWLAAMPTVRRDRLFWECVRTELTARHTDAEEATAEQAVAVVNLVQGFEALLMGMTPGVLPEATGEVTSNGVKVTTTVSVTVVVADNAALNTMLAAVDANDMVAPIGPNGMTATVASVSGTTTKTYVLTIARG